MKKTYNINLAGQPFVIDSDAYAMLDEYLKALSHAFPSQSDSDEFITDIENRTAELLIDYLEAHHRGIVSIDEVREVISKIGRPEDVIETDTIVEEKISGENFSEYDESTERCAEGTTSPESESKSSAHDFSQAATRNAPVKRLFRDPNNRMIGGVCSGIAEYLGWDATWVRVITVALAFLSFSTVAILYFILWMVVPEAKTPLQILQMKGESPTIENISRTVASEFKHADNGKPEKPRGMKGFTNGLMSIFAVLFKVLMVIVMIIAIPIMFALIIGLLGLIFALFVSLGGWSFMALKGDLASYFPAETYWGLACAISIIIVIGIPCWSLIMLAIRKLRGDNHSDNTDMNGTETRGRGIWKRWMAVVWFIAFVVAGISAGVCSSFPFDKEKTEKFDVMIEKLESLDEDDEVEAPVADTTQSIDEATSNTGKIVQTGPTSQTKQ